MSWRQGGRGFETIIFVHYFICSRVYISMEQRSEYFKENLELPWASNRKLKIVPSRPNNRFSMHTLFHAILLFSCPPYRLFFFLSLFFPREVETARIFLRSFSSTSFLTCISLSLSLSRFWSLTSAIEQLEQEFQSIRPSASFPGKHRQTRKIVEPTEARK